MAFCPKIRRFASSVLALVAAGTLLSCGDSVVFESVGRRATVADLPTCAVENAGEELFVEDERMLYTCGEEGWAPFAKPTDTTSTLAKMLLRSCGADMAPDDTVSKCGEDGTFTDSRDGRVYKCVKIGDQTWMAENLDFGEAITGDQTHASAVYAQKYCLDNDTANCATYGGLYEWPTAMGLCAERGEVIQTPHHRGICPAGWHVPAQEEWQTLVEFVRSPTENDAGRALKSKTGWDEQPFCTGWNAIYPVYCLFEDVGVNGIDAYEWNALPGGFLDNISSITPGFGFPAASQSHNEAIFKRTAAEFWTATEVKSSPYEAVKYSIGATTDSAWSGTSEKKWNSARSLRCVQD